MKAFIKPMDEKALRAILTGLDHPMKMNESGESVFKSKIKWSTNECKLANSNSKALNVIFNAIYANQFKLISTCESVKEA